MISSRREDDYDVTVTSHPVYYILLENHPACDNRTADLIMFSRDLMRAYRVLEMSRVSSQAGSCRSAGVEITRERQQNLREVSLMMHFDRSFRIILGHEFNVKLRQNETCRRYLFVIIIPI